MSAAGVYDNILENIIPAVAHTQKNTDCGANKSNLFHLVFTIIKKCSNLHFWKCLFHLSNRQDFMKTFF